MARLLPSSFLVATLTPGRSWHLPRSSRLVYGSHIPRWLPGFRRAGPSTPLDEQYEIVGGSLRMRSVTLTEVVSYFPRWVIRIILGRTYDEIVQVICRRMFMFSLQYRDANST